MRVSTATVLSELNAALAVFENSKRYKRFDDFSGLDPQMIGHTTTTLISAIERFAPPASAFVTNVRDVLKRYGPDNSVVIPLAAGIVESLRSAYQRGALESVSQLVRADLFGDFLEMSDHLLNEGYKDAAAVMVGGVLEEHLRKLCDACSISTEKGGKAKKADTLNAELAAAGAYNKLDQKNATAWLDLRNKAAHGHYGEYTADQVKNMLAGVRTFLAQTI
jgi:hypothetical protein